MKPLFIGIDPDVDKSGFAVYDAESKSLTAVCSAQFFWIFPYFKTWQCHIALVRIEAGWLNEKSNFHHRRGQSKTAGERIAKNVGANHETGRKLAEMCEYLEIEYDLVRPLGTKNIDHRAFIRMTGWTGRTNQDMRDAAMLVYGFKTK